MNKPKIALGWISGDMVDLPFQESVLKYLDFDSKNAAITYNFGFRKALYIDDKRNELIRDFLKIPVDYFMSLDSDIQFDPPQIYQLVDEAVNNDRAITAGCYFTFLHPTSNFPMPVWFEKLVEGGSLQVYSDFGPGPLVVPLAAVGMGFTLIRRDVFEAFLKVPEYANDDWTWFGREPYLWHDLPKHYGEDMSFCVRAGKLGFQTWGHRGVCVRHWKKVGIDLHLFKAMAQYAKSLGIPV